MQRKDTCPLCRARFSEIKANGRAYKVDPPRPAQRPAPRPHAPPRAHLFVPVFFNNISTTFNIYGSSMMLNQSFTTSFPMATGNNQAASYFFFQSPAFLPSQPFG
jgi:hypothetical protein